MNVVDVTLDRSMASLNVALACPLRGTPLAPSSGVCATTSGVVNDEQLVTYIKDQTDPQQCADGLGQLALDAGSRDNVSCIVFDVVEK